MKSQIPRQRACWVQRREGESPRQPRCVFMTHSVRRTGKTGEITAVERLFSINIYLFFQRNSLNISLTQSELICLHIPGSIWREGNPASLVSRTHEWPTGKLPPGQLQIRTCKGVTAYSLCATLCAFGAKARRISTFFIFFLICVLRSCYVVELGIQLKICTFCSCLVSIS